MRWRIYYDDGASFDDARQARGERRPGYGALVVVQANPRTGRDILHRFEYYLLKGGRWYGCDIIGLHDHIFDAGCFDELQAVVCGRNVSDEVFQAVYARAKADPEFPPKSATGQYEQPRQNIGVIG